MTTQSEQITEQLRQMLFEGAFEPGSRLQEIALASRLEVSRTPVRLALAALAQEGLLVYKPQRGFLVRAFSLEEIVDAIRVRGELEAMACRLLAERAEPAVAVFESLAANVEAMAGLLNGGRISSADRMRFLDLNTAFHDAILEASGNETLVTLSRQIARMPMAGPAGMGPVVQRLEGVEAVFEASVREHGGILDALVARQSSRAQAQMREHLYGLSESVRLYLDRLRDTRGHSARPFLRLISGF
ncbi:GntR family transcriptional regulator [Paroceanicella profunda]|nr:GntR family transcriptional regulator [Paroceanicella profunda]